MPRRCKLQLYLPEPATDTLTLQLILAEDNFIQNLSNNSSPLFSSEFFI